MYTTKHPLFNSTMINPNVNNPVHNPYSFDEHDNYNQVVTGPQEEK